MGASEAAVTAGREGAGAAAEGERPTTTNCGPCGKVAATNCNYTRVVIGHCGSRTELDEARGMATGPFIAAIIFEPIVAPTDTM